MSIQRIMSQDIVTVEMDDSLRAIRDIFENCRFHHLLVVSDSGELKGVISDRDLLKTLSPNIDTVRETSKDLATLNRKVHQIMTRELVTVSVDDTVKHAIHLFNRHHLSCLPVIDSHNKPIGILSWRDIFRAIESRYQTSSSPNA